MADPMMTGLNYLTQWVQNLLGGRSSPPEAPKPMQTPFQTQPWLQSLYQLAASMPTYQSLGVRPSAGFLPSTAPTRNLPLLLKGTTSQASQSAPLPMLLKGLSARTPIDTAGMGYHMEDRGYGNVPARTMPAAQTEQDQSWVWDPDAYNYAALAQQKALAEAQMAQDWAIMQAQLEQRKREMAAQIGQAMVAQASQNWSRGLPYVLPKGTEYAPGTEPTSAMSQIMARRGLNYQPTKLAVSNPMTKEEMEQWVSDAIGKFM